MNIVELTNQALMDMGRAPLDPLIAAVMTGDTKVTFLTTAVTKLGETLGTAWSDLQVADYNYNALYADLQEALIEMRDTKAELEQTRLERDAAREQLRSIGLIIMPVIDSTLTYVKQERVLLEQEA